MSYKILEPRQQLYHRDVITAAWDTLSTHHKLLLQYVAEMPRLSHTKHRLSPAEAFSDLIIPRVPRFINNFQGADLQEVRDTLEYQEQIISAVSNTVNYQKNLRESDPKQREFLEYLGRLFLVDKKYKAYLRSCIRRTKLKYLQHQSKNDRTVTVDPTNGLREAVDYRSSYDSKNFCNHSDQISFLKNSNLTDKQKRVLIGVAIEEKSFVELGAELQMSRSSTARLYQSAVQRLQGEMLRDSTVKEIREKYLS